MQQRAVVLLLSGVLGAGLLLGGCAARSPEGEVFRVEAPSPPGDGKAEVGKPYFDFAARELMGGRFVLSDLIGKHVVLLQFWGIRCRPCLDEIPFLAQLQREYGPRGLQVVGVNTDRLEPDRLTEAMVQRQLIPPYPVVLDPELEIARHYLVHWPLIPVSVLIDRRGWVEYIHTGYKPAMNETIRAEVERLLGESR